MRTLFIFSLLIAISFSCTNEDTSRKRKVIYTPNAPSPIGPYSQAVLVDGTLYMSGQIGLKKGVLDSLSVENQCEQTLLNLKAVLEEAGMKMGDICKTTVYLTDLADFEKMNTVFARHFGPLPPARETVQVSKLPKNARVEISAVAR